MKVKPCSGCWLIKRAQHLIQYSILLISVLVSPRLFSQVPTITSFSPTSAAMGNTVIITGTYLNGATAVSFGGIAATSFKVVSSTQVNAVVPLGATGSINVTTPVQTATRVGFYYLPLSGIITDFAGYWPTTTANVNAVFPDNSHNLLAFTYNGITYSTGVNNATLTGQGIDYVPGNFRAVPVSNIAGTNTGSSIYLAMASKVDGNATVANASALTGVTIKDVMTDGINGLNMGTGITNLPATAVMTFAVNLIHPEKISDGQPDIIITQIADPSSGNDVFQFVNSAGVTVGNSITQDMTLLNKLGTYSLDLFNLSPGSPFNSAICYNAFATSNTREIRLVGFKLSDFGVTMANYSQVASLKISPSGTSDYAFIAYSDAIEMAPNIAQNIDKTNNSVCSGGTASLEVITSAAMGGTLSYIWQESANGGTIWSTVTNGGNYSGATTGRLSVAAAVNNYKYRATVTESGTGYNATCSPFTIAVAAYTAPTGVTVATSAGTTCLNNLVSLSCAVTGGSNLFYQWESNASGSFLSVPDAILKTYLPPVSSTGAISYRLKVSSGSGCNGSVTSSAVMVTVVGISSVTPAARCGTGTVSLGATATSGTISWYAASIGGTALATGATYAPSISATTTYYVATDATQCTTAGRVAITATINSIIWAGTNTTDWSTIANWDCGGTPPAALPTLSNDVTIPATPSGGRFPTVNTTAPVNNITISQGASITVSASGIFEIYGAISNSGTFTSTSGTISMRGAAQQIIPANTFTSNTIKNLVINNTSGVLLNGALSLTGTYTPAAGMLTTFGYLTLKSNAAGTARVAAGTGSYILGNVNVERYVPARRSWRMMTAPLTNANSIFESWQNKGVYAPGQGMLVTAPGGGTGIDAAGKSSLKTWNASTQSFQAVSNTKVPVSALNTGAADNTGYFVFVRGDRDPSNIDPNLINKNITTLTSTGYLQTNTQSFTGLSAAAGGCSLIGNPYASPVDFNLIFSNTGVSNIKRKFYVWDPQLNSVGGYVVLDDVLSPGTFKPTPATSSQGNNIQSGQAFFVITNAAGNAGFEIKESNKAAANNTTVFGRPATENIKSLITNLFLLDTTDNSIVSADGARADFNDAFSAGIDDLDNLKYSNVNETFGILRNNTFLASERRPLDNNDTLFLQLKKCSHTNYQLQFAPSGFNGTGIVAKFEDTYMNTSVIMDLTRPSKINFNINPDTASQSHSRFRIVFSPIKKLFVFCPGIKVSPQKNKIAIEWQMDEETNIARYEVERSADSSTFSCIKTTGVAAGNKVSGKAYKSIDEHPVTDANFYRVRAITLDGQVHYSKTVRANIDEKISFSVYPNPVVDKIIHIRLNNQPAGQYTVKLSSATGQLILKSSFDNAGGNSIKNIALPAGTPAGNYQLLITGRGRNVTPIKIFVPQ